MPILTMFQSCTSSVATLCATPPTEEQAMKDAETALTDAGQILSRVATKLGMTATEAQAFFDAHSAKVDQAVASLQVIAQVYPQMAPTVNLIVSAWGDVKVIDQGAQKVATDLSGATPPTSVQGLANSIQSVQQISADVKFTLNTLQAHNVDVSAALTGLNTVNDGLAKLSTMQQQLALVALASVPLNATVVTSSAPVVPSTPVVNTTVVQTPTAAVTATNQTPEAQQPTNPSNALTMQ